MNSSDITFAKVTTFHAGDTCRVGFDSETGNVVSVSRISPSGRVIPIKYSKLSPSTAARWTDCPGALDRE